MRVTANEWCDSRGATCCLVLVGLLVFRLPFAPVLAKGDQMSTPQGKQKVDAEKILRCASTIILVIVRVASLVWICFHG